MITEDLRIYKACADIVDACGSSRVQTRCEWRMRPEDAQADMEHLLNLATLAGCRLEYRTIQEMIVRAPRRP